VGLTACLEKLGILTPPGFDPPDFVCGRKKMDLNFNCFKENLVYRNCSVSQDRTAQHFYKQSSCTYFCL